MTYEEARQFTTDCMGFTCEHCGWQNDCKEKGRASEYEYTVQQALEKQILRKPLAEGDNESDYYLCPTCNGILADHELEWGEEVPNYCPKCGQKLDWGCGQK